MPEVRLRRGSEAADHGLIVDDTALVFVGVYANPGVTVTIEFGADVYTAAPVRGERVTRIPASRRVPVVFGPAPGRFARDDDLAWRIPYTRMVTHHDHLQLRTGRV